MKNPLLSVEYQTPYLRELLTRNFEAIVWTCAFVWLACSDPAEGLRFSLCPLENLGIKWCPGCGLGRAISSVMHGDLVGSLRYHLLGIPATCVLVARITTLVQSALQHRTRDRSHHHPSKEPVCPTSCN